MKKIYLSIAALLLVSSANLWAGDNKKISQGKLPEPTLVQSVDATEGTITIGKKGAESQTYKFDKAFGRVIVNGKQGDLTQVEVGMKVNITASGTKASRVEADTYVPKAEPKKK